MLISCIAYQDGEKGADIATHQIHQYVNQPDCLVRVALREAAAATLEEMRNEFALHPLALEDAQHGHQGPKLEEYGDSRFTVRHTIEPAALTAGNSSGSATAVRPKIQGES